MKKIIAILMSIGLFFTALPAQANSKVYYYGPANYWNSTITYISGGVQVTCHYKQNYYYKSSGMWAGTLTPSYRLKTNQFGCPGIHPNPPFK